jgi:CheY-like chemotaxis protein/phosphoribosyl 1,2-cyclic phosphodiesterase
MLVRFWGTRGSLAKPGASTVRYGGNTACVEVRGADGTLIVLDCGTGAHGLGQALLANGPKPLRGHLLITHTHWDHIQGFPFFAPLFISGNEWDIYAPGGLGQHLESTLAGQMEYQYFPVTLANLGATIRFHDLEEGTFRVGGVQVTTRYLNHPAMALGYHLDDGSATVVYASDHEPHAMPPAAGEAGTNGASFAAAPDGLPIHEEDRRHVEFLRDADLVIHDAQYTLAEYAQGKSGWGHTPIEQAVDFAALAGAKGVALIHHDPLRTDDELDKLVLKARTRPLAKRQSMDVIGAAEGLDVELGTGATLVTAGQTANGATNGAAQLDGAGNAVVEVTARSGSGETVIIADDEADILDLLAEILEPEGLRLLLASDGEAALRLAKQSKASLMLLDWEMPNLSGLEVVRALRKDAESRLNTLPVVLLTARTREEDTAEGFSAGATDYLTKPFTPAHVRTRVREWLMRAKAARLTAAK